MPKFRNCLQCDVSFEYLRNDHYFCSGKCVAKFYRENPNPELIHADLPHDIPCYCEWCGSPYNVNGYANRGGQRTPKYCNRAHKQAAYRQRGREAQEQAARRNERQDYDRSWNEHDSSRTWREHAQRQAPPPPPPPPPPHYSTKWEEACAILGVHPLFTSEDELKKIYRKKMYEVHPDRNKSPNATEQAQKVNWAYSYLRAKRR